MLFRWVFPFGFKVITVYGLLISIVCSGFLLFLWSSSTAPVFVPRLLSCVFPPSSGSRWVFDGCQPLTPKSALTSRLEKWVRLAARCCYSGGGWGVAKARVSDRSMSTSICTYRCIYTSTLWLRYTHTYLFEYVYINIYLYTYIYRYILIYICCYII